MSIHELISLNQFYKLIYLLKGENSDNLYIRCMFVMNYIEVIKILLIYEIGIDIVFGN